MTNVTLNIVAAAELTTDVAITVTIAAYSVTITAEITVAICNALCCNLIY